MHRWMDGEQRCIDVWMVTYDVWMDGKLRYIVGWMANYEA